MTVGAALVGDQSGHVHAPEIVVRLVQLVNLIIVPPAILHENLRRTSACGTRKKKDVPLTHKIPPTLLQIQLERLRSAKCQDGRLT